MTAGYSGTPLVRKLGIKTGTRCAFLDPPERYREMLGELARDLTAVDASKPGFDFVHLFVREQAGLAGRLRHLHGTMAKDGIVWVSWPKKASRVQTDVTEGVVRRAGLSAGLVDVKVCAVDVVWSGRKLVIRRANRR